MDEVRAGQEMFAEQQLRVGDDARVVVPENIRQLAGQRGEPPQSFEGLLGLASIKSTIFLQLIHHGEEPFLERDPTH